MMTPCDTSWVRYQPQEALCGASEKFAFRARVQADAVPTLWVLSIKEKCLHLDRAIKRAQEIARECK